MLTLVLHLLLVKWLLKLVVGEGKEISLAVGEGKRIIKLQIVSGV